MSRLSQKITSKLALLAVIFVASLLAVTVTGTRGLQRTAGLADTIYADHLTTERVTVDVGRLLDEVYRTADALALSPDAPTRDVLRARLYAAQPSVEVALDRLRSAHGDDDRDEQAALGGFAAAWRDASAKVLAPLLVATDQRAPSEEQVSTTFAPLLATVQQLIDREQSDAAAAREKARSVYRSSQSLIVRIAAMALLGGLLTVIVLIRRVVPRALASEEDQAAFGEVIALAEDEHDAQDLLRRHLERSVRDSTTVVLRRNNSANRLEAATAIAPGSPLHANVEGAEPRACVAVRTSRPHLQSAERDLLLSCRVCGDCPGTSLCTPLTVGGEVIGAVLVQATRRPDADDERRVRESVLQAAPVLANLRNLAVAEFRAATDSLTGLPNRRAITDASRRMLAQAARTSRPLAVLSLDLDHFKQINDQFGHAVGDEVLAAVGAALRSTLRASDFAGRNGGEEFVVLLPDVGVEGALGVAAKLHTALGEIAVAAIGRRITASIGLAVFPDHAVDVAGLERSADRALYTAKNNGRDRTEVCVPPMPLVPVDATDSGLGAAPPVRGTGLQVRTELT